MEELFKNPFCVRFFPINHLLKLKHFLLFHISFWVGQTRKTCCHILLCSDPSFPYAYVVAAGLAFQTSFSSSCKILTCYQARWVM